MGEPTAASMNLKKKPQTQSHEIPDLSLSQWTSLIAPESFPWMFLLLACVTVQSVCDFILPYIIVYSVFTRILSVSDTSARSVTTIFWPLVTLFATRILSLMAFQYITSYRKPSVLVTIRERLLRNYLRQDTFFTVQVPTQAVSSIFFQESNQIYDRLFIMPIQAYGIFVRLAGALSICFFYSWKLTLMQLVYLPMSMYATYLLQQRALPILLREQTVHLQNVEHAKEIIEKQPTIQTFQCADPLVSNYVDCAQRLAAIQRQASSTMMWNESADQLIQNIFTVATFMFSFWQIHNGSLDTSAFFLFQMYGSTLISYVKQTLDIIMRMLEAKSVLRTFIYLYEKQPIVDPDRGLPWPKQSPAKEHINDDAAVHNHLVLTKLSGPFKTPSDVTLKIESGTWTSIIGASGSGKSTVFSMLHRSMFPSSGSIRLHTEVHNQSKTLTSLHTATSNSIYDLRLSDWRRHILYVSPHDAWFRTSIRRNLTCFRDNITQAEIERACDIACVRDIIEALPDGYNSWLMSGPIGVKYKPEQVFHPSSGIKQRLAIARAILFRPSILMLDEATSHLDVHTEKKVLSRLREFFTDSGGRRQANNNNNNNNNNNRRLVVKSAGRFSITAGARRATPALSTVSEEEKEDLPDPVNPEMAIVVSNGGGDDIAHHHHHSVTDRCTIESIITIDHHLSNIQYADEIYKIDNDCSRTMRRSSVAQLQQGVTSFSSGASHSVDTVSSADIDVDVSEETYVLSRPLYAVRVQPPNSELANHDASENGNSSSTNGEYQEHWMLLTPETDPFVTYPLSQSGGDNNNHSSSRSKSIVLRMFGPLYMTRDQLQARFPVHKQDTTYTGKTTFELLRVWDPRIYTLLKNESDVLDADQLWRVCVRDDPEKTMSISREQFYEWFVLRGLYDVNRSE